MSKTIRLISILLVLAILVAGGAVLGPRLIHRCDNCDRAFVGTGYYANVISDSVSSLFGNDSKILCSECAGISHALELMAGKSLGDFRRPLFENAGD